MYLKPFEGGKGGRRDKIADNNDVLRVTPVCTVKNAKVTQTHRPMNSVHPSVECTSQSHVRETLLINQHVGTKTCTNKDSDTHKYQ